MSNKRLSIYNIIATCIMQFLAIISGFVVPRIILEYFGSELNGLVSSISQFLSYIQLLEGGVSAVAMSALYKALAKNDIDKVSAIVKSIDAFFKKIGWIYIGYSICVAVIYPFVIKSSYTFVYISTLALIIAFGTFSQYFFALTFRTLITADRRGYVVYLTHALLSLINILLTVFLVKVYPSIHVLKFATVIAFMIQPIIFSIYVKMHYSIDKSCEPDKDALSQRWDGFGHNLAYFIHTNTDVVVLTFFTSLSTVSIYSVHYSIVNALKSLIVSISAGIKPSFGNVLASSDQKYSNLIFDYYELGINYVSTVMFGCCILLIGPFINVYTNGITDTNYNQPLFAFLLCLSSYLYCLRDPLVSAVYAAGHFKQTAKYSYLEAAINILASIVLVYRFGLIGIVIGTLLSIIIRNVLQAQYLRNNILERSLIKWIKGLICCFLSISITYVLVKAVLNYSVNSYGQWFAYALVCSIVSIAVTSLVFVIFNKKLVRSLCSTIISRKNEK